MAGNLDDCLLQVVGQGNGFAKHVHPAGFPILPEVNPEHVGHARQIGPQLGRAILEFGNWAKDGNGRLAEFRSLHSFQLGINVINDITPRWRGSAGSRRCLSFLQKCPKPGGNRNHGVYFVDVVREKLGRFRPQGSKGGSCMHQGIRHLADLIALGLHDHAKNVQVDVSVYAVVAKACGEEGCSDAILKPRGIVALVVQIVLRSSKDIEPALQSLLVPWSGPAFRGQKPHALPNHVQPWVLDCLPCVRHGKLLGREVRICLNCQPPEKLLGVGLGFGLGVGCFEAFPKIHLRHHHRHFGRKDLLPELRELL